MKLTRKQIREGLDTVPMDAILGKDVSRELTAKQKRFAFEVAKGATKADAYRRAYKADATRATILGEPYRVASNPVVSAEIQAYQQAIEAAKYRTPAALRELVIQSLVSVVINPETKDSVKVAAAKVLGTVTEVAAFTERKEIKTISTSADAKNKILSELKRIMHTNAEDIGYTESEASDLLSELSGADITDTQENPILPTDKPSPDANTTENVTPGDAISTQAGTGNADPTPRAPPDQAQTESR